MALRCADEGGGGGGRNEKENELELSESFVKKAGKIMS